MPEPLTIHETLTIPESDISWTAVRSSGPGGQHVNKTSTRVELRFGVRRCEVLDDETKGRLIRLAGSRVVGDDEILITSSLSRDQSRNLADAREKLRVLIVKALLKPKSRRTTRPSHASLERRIESKRKRSVVKKGRSSRVGIEE